ncbi:MAG: hypothetical protein JSR29_20040 [Nitrospira sp.]|nr:hypothetical protein [Nitrospira sp.]
MSSVINQYTNVKTASPTTCEPKPQPCSTCGQLECLCRPRFFAGQVLTADDLNRLDYYIRAKHRLHNRQLHGWGVVNGLEVTCDSCGKGVVVGCGYALSPCGDDIVVCQPVLVDVCTLIKACRQAERLNQPCAPFQHAQPSGCDEDSEWVLAIRYAETPTRGVKPLMSSNGTPCQCGCTPTSCTCKTAPAKRPRTAPVQCEPTVICEGFEFEVYRKPKNESDPCQTDNKRDPLALNPDSELYQRLQCCWEALVVRFPKPPNETDLSGFHDWMCRFKDFLQRYLSSKPGYNCELLARLNTIVCPPNNPDALGQIQETIGLLVLVWLDALLACFCSALLPPCPTAHPDARVPIATFKVSADSCRVLSICNWTHYRKIAATFPSLHYWLDILPFGIQLRCLLEQICCFQIMARVPQQDSSPPSSHAATGGQPHGADTFVMPPMYAERAQKRLNPKVPDPERLAGVSSLLRSAMVRRQSGLDPKTFVESFFLADKDKTAAHLSSIETANLSQFLLLNQILEPIATGAFGQLLGGKDLASEDAEITALKKQMATLQTRLNAQDKEIAKIKKGKGG